MCGSGKEEAQHGNWTVALISKPHLSDTKEDKNKQTNKRGWGFQLPEPGIVVWLIFNEC